MGVVAKVENDLYSNEFRTAHVNTATTRKIISTMSAPHAIDAYVSQKLSIKKRFIKIEKKNYLSECEVKDLP